MRLSDRFTALVLGGLLCCAVASAQGTEALPFIRIDRNPVSAGMGFAGAASTSATAYSSFRNSAVIPFSAKTMDLGFNYQGWAPSGVKNTNLNFGGAYKLSEKMGFSIGGAYQMGQEYDIFDASGHAKGSFKPSDMVINAGVGFLLTESLSLGVNARYASQGLADGVSLSAFCADAFLLYRMGGVNMTAGISSIGSSVKGDDGASYKLPASATLGVDWSTTFSDVHGIELAADADYFLSGNIAAAFGAQYGYNDLFFLRAGLHVGTGNAVLPTFVTLGAGVKFSGISINLAYLTANEVIGNTITAGIGYSF